MTLPLKWLPRRSSSLPVPASAMQIEFARGGARGRGFMTNNMGGTHLSRKPLSKEQLRAGRGLFEALRLFQREFRRGMPLQYVTDITEGLS
jgi:hypothetical protein